MIRYWYTAYRFTNQTEQVFDILLHHHIQLTVHLGDLIMLLISLAIPETMLVLVNSIKHTLFECDTQSLLSVIHETLVI
jgi:hypothetical protein